MIEYIDGDLLEMFDKGEVDAIAHCCNCQGVMGSGIALSIKQRYPEAYDKYVYHCSRYYNTSKRYMLGSISFHKYETEKPHPRFVINLHAQEAYGKTKMRYVDYEGLYSSLNDALLLVEDYKVPTIGVPYLIGCDRAGGDWRIVDAMLNTLFEQSKDVTLKVVKLTK